MCDFSRREQAMVVVRPGVHCDPCLVPLVRALYEGGFPTVASCCGHGKQPATVALADGREVFVADPEWSEVIWAAISAKRDAPSDQVVAVLTVAEAQTLAGIGFDGRHNLTGTEKLKKALDGRRADPRTGLPVEEGERNAA